MASDTTQIQTGIGHWLLCQLYSLWYDFYGLFITTIQLKAVWEMFAKYKRYNPEKEQNHSGEVVVITGGPRGIAYDLVKKLLQMDFTVIMGSPDVTKSQLTVDEIRNTGVMKGEIHMLPLNLKSLSSTREFAENVLQHTSRIDFLLNNAGTMMTPYEITEDGYESQFQVNYLSHFLLTLLLLPAIKRTAKDRKTSCRIVHTSSVYHLPGSINFEDLETPKYYAPSKSYFDSKLCLVIFAKQLEERLRSEKANVHVYCVHPGAIPTDLWLNAGSFYPFAGRVVKPIMPDTENGAEAVLYAALSSDLETKGGSYLEAMNIATPNSQVHSKHLQAELWKRSEVLCRPAESQKRKDQ